MDFERSHIRSSFGPFIYLFIFGLNCGGTASWNHFIFFVNLSHLLKHYICLSLYITLSTDASASEYNSTPAQFALAIVSEPPVTSKRANTFTTMFEHISTPHFRISSSRVAASNRAGLNDSKGDGHEQTRQSLPQCCTLRSRCVKTSRRSHIQALRWKT